MYMYIFGKKPRFNRILHREKRVIITLSRLTDCSVNRIRTRYYGYNKFIIFYKYRNFFSYLNDIYSHSNNDYKSDTRSGFYTKRPYVEEKKIWNFFKFVSCTKIGWWVHIIRCVGIPTTYYIPTLCPRVRVCARTTDGRLLLNYLRLFNKSRVTSD